MDFEEELGSPNLPAAVNSNRKILSADHLIIFDGPKHRSGKPTLTFGARGIGSFTELISNQNNESCANNVLKKIIKYLIFISFFLERWKKPNLFYHRAK